MSLPLVVLCDMRPVLAEALLLALKKQAAVFVGVWREPHAGRRLAHSRD